MSAGLLRPWRWLAALLQAGLLLGLPFMTINSRSVLRFDVPSLRLYFLGSSIAIDEFYLVAAGLLFVVMMFMAVTMLMGRLWCGWACPQTVLSDITSFLERASGTARAAMYLPVAALSMLVAADLIWYFVSPYEFIPMLGSSPVVRWSFIAISVIVFIDLVFIRRVFCRTVCPYARLQSVLFDDRTMLIAYDPSRSGECMGCEACRRACPVGIDIRDGLDMACISCAECVDACTRMRAKVNRDSLVGYFWGSPDSGQGGQPGSLMFRPLRINVILAMLASAVFLFMLLLGLSTRQEFAATIRLNPEFAPRVAAGTTRVNSYILSIRNHTTEEALFTLSSADARISSRDKLRLPPEGAGRFTIYAAIDTGTGLGLTERIKIKVSGPGGVIMLEAPFPAR